MLEEDGVCLEGGLEEAHPQACAWRDEDARVRA